MPDAEGSVLNATVRPAPTRDAFAIGRFVSRGVIVWVLIALIVLCRILYPGFLDRDNVFNILSQNAQVGLIALGMTFVMIAGGFDLSVGAIYAAGATVYAMEAQTWPLPIAAIIALAVGAVAGTLNGLIVTWLRVNPFIATLGTTSIFSGAAYLYSHSAPVLVDRPDFTTLGAGKWFNVPISLYILLFAYAAGWLVLSKTVYGRSLYAVGGNPEAARLSGLRVDLLKTSTYVLVGVLAAFGGMIIASRLSIGQADIAGTMSLDAIAIVIIGGTSLFGGSGSVWRTAVGLLLLAVLTNIFDALALDSNFQSLIKGAIGCSCYRCFLARPLKMATSSE
jgi:ribose transport system permease protein